jgi:chemotaxis protein MotB
LTPKTKKKGTAPNELNRVCERNHMIGEEKRGLRAGMVWPGYVDALSALLMVVIFVILIFTIAQFLLTQILSDQEGELAALHRQVSELAELLGLEKEQGEALTRRVAELSGMIETLTREKSGLTAQVAELSSQSEQDQAQIRKQLLMMASLQEDIDQLRQVRADLEQKVAGLVASLADKETEAGELRDRTKSLEARLADERERTVLAQKELDQRDVRIQALSALVGEQKQALEQERKLTADARAELALLNQQVRNMRSQLEEISRALQVAETANATKEAKIEELGKKLNIALARQVSKLEQYRSEFFGRLRKVLGDNPQVRIEGDRFVLQAELLFESGSAEIGVAGRQHLEKLASTLKTLSIKIPKEINWILRIDGHTDRVPIHNEKFASNWELSTARAVSVVRFLADQGIPQNRMAAAGFGEFHPIDPSNTPEAYQKNRRIEIKLTSR